MCQSTRDLIKQLVAAVAVSDPMTILDVADRLSEHIGYSAVVAVTQALVEDMEMVPDVPPRMVVKGASGLARCA